MEPRYTIWELIKSLFIKVDKPEYNLKPKTTISDPLKYITTHFGNSNTKYDLSKQLNCNIFTYLDIIDDSQKSFGRFLTPLEILKIGVRNSFIFKTKNIGIIGHIKTDTVIDSMFKAKSFKDHLKFKI